MTYWVVVTRERDAWLADVPECEGSSTFSRAGLAGLDAEVREVVVLAEDLPDGAEDTVELAWILDVPARDLAREFGNGWTLADVAAALRVPVERVTHTPPSLGRRFGRWVTLVWWSWRSRRRLQSRATDGDDEVGAAAAA